MQQLIIKWILLLKEEEKSTSEIIREVNSSAVTDLTMPLLGLALDNQEYDIAHEVLDNVKSDDKEMDDFVKTQRINIEYLKHKKNFVFNPVDSMELRTIALASHPSAGYARSLFRAITNERLYAEIPENQSAEGRSSERRVISKYKVFPNPVNDVINIESSIAQKLNYLLVDIHGKTVKTGMLNAARKWNLSVEVIPSGIYSLILSDNRGDRTVKKIIVTQNNASSKL